MVYQREREIQERQTFHRKQQLKDALANGKSLPTELRRDAVKLGKDLQFDEAQVGECTHFSPIFRSGALTIVLFCPWVCYFSVLSNVLEPSSLIDSEYAKAGILDPKIVITTSRDPSSRLLQFSKARPSHRSNHSSP